MDPISAAAASGAKTAVDAGTTGTPWALLIVFAMISMAAFIVIAYMLIKHRDKETSPGSCGPGGNGGSCPEVHGVIAAIKGLEKRMDEDAENRREHRSHLEATVDRIHSRIDTQNKVFAQKDEVDRLAGIFHQAVEEMGRVSSMFVAMTEAQPPIHRRSSATKRASSAQ